VPRKINIDVDGDGKIEQDDIDAVKAIEEIDRMNRRQMSQRKMAWVAMWSMILFTLLLFSPLIPESRVNALSDLLGLFYIAQAGVVGAFLGVTAWMNKK
jgi:hypothetical protein